MRQKIENSHRRAEVVTGLFLILVAVSYIAALLLDFKFVSRDGTVMEDLTYLSEHVRSQLISAISWGITGLMTLLAIPFYLRVFKRVFRALPYINTVLLLGAASGFILMGLTGMELYREMVKLPAEGLQQADENISLMFLDLYRKEQLVRYIGSSCVGLFAVGMSLKRTRMKRFPVITSVLLMLSGPVMIFFNWYDPEHLARTGAMTGIIIGITVLCVRMINRGLNDRS